MGGERRGISSLSEKFKQIDIYIPNIDEQTGLLHVCCDKNEESTDWLINFIEMHSRPADLSEWQDKQFAITICKIVKEKVLETKPARMLIDAIAARFADQRESFRDRAAILSTALFKRDEFNIKKLRSFKEFEELLDIKAYKTECKEKEDEYVGGLYVENDLMGCDAPHSPIFIQNATAILKQHENINEMKMVHLEFENIIRRTSPRTLQRCSDGIFTELMNLNTPKLYDLQFKSLAILIKSVPHYFTKILDELFRTKLETKQFYIIYTLCYLHNIIDDELLLFEMHMEFCTKLMKYSGQFSEVVRKQCVEFILAGKRLAKKYE